MAAINLGDARKRSNTGGSTEDSEDRVILLSCEDTSNFQSESELSDDVNDDNGHMMNKQLIPERGANPQVSIRHNQSLLQRYRQWYRYFCPEKYRKAWLALFVSLLGLTLLVMVIVPLRVWEDMPRKTCADLIDADEFAPFIFEPNEGGMFILCHDKELLVSGTLAMGRHYSSQQVNLEYEYLPDATLNLSRTSDNCVRIKWNGVTDVNKPLIDCFDMGDGHWFGGYESFNQQWPIGGNNGIPATPFVPRDYTNDNSDNFGSILHPVWASSKGVIMFVDEDTPLVISVNESNSNRICLQATPSSLKCAPGISSPVKLYYTVCGFDNITKAVKYFISESGNVPVNDSARNPSTPDPDILQYPIWSTEYVTNNDAWGQQDILDYVDSAVKNGYDISLLEIGHMFSESRGELQFSSSRFPNVTEFKEKLKDLGVNLSVTVSPFIDSTSSIFTEAIANDILYPGYSNIQQNDIALVKWNEGYGSIVNYMNQTVADQQRADLLDFIKTNRVRSLRFEGGSSTHVPRCVYSFNVTTPTQYTSRYADFVSQLQLSSPDLSSTAVSAGYFNQDSVSIFKLANRNSASWGLNNGLRSVLTSILSLGIAGYPYTYTSSNGDPSSKELYVRWLQLLTFLPVMHISYPPWELSNSTIADHVKYLINLHSEVYTNYIKPFLAKNSQHRYPIIRPMWWMEDNSDFISINDQFFVGDLLLVAPILDPLPTNRTVLIPDGNWTCLSCSGEESYTRPGSYRFKITRLTDMLYFIKSV